MSIDEEIKLEDMAANTDDDDGQESTIIYDHCDLGKPAPDEWFKLYDLNGKGIKGYIRALIAKRKDATGQQQPYLIAGTDDFEKKCRQKIRPTQYVRVTYGITTGKRLFVWPVVEVKDIADVSNKWHLTAWEIANSALTRWTQISSDKAHHRYIHGDLDRQGDVPKLDVYTNPPKEMGYQTAVNKAFRGRIVKDETHRIYLDAGSVIKSKIDSPFFKKKVSKNGK
tara:strand:- start:1034 stop:1708 length:675 start_codon:yes stop_codon:yes gene_type:complete